MNEIVLIIALASISLVVIILIVYTFKSHDHQYNTDGNSILGSNKNKQNDLDTSSINQPDDLTFALNVTSDEALIKDDLTFALSVTSDDTPIKMESTSTDIQFKLSQTRVQGHSHKKAAPQIPCQDHGKAGTLSNGYHVLLVSDGAGSSKLSHVASEFCVNTLYSYLQVVDFKDFQNRPNETEQSKEKWHNTVKDLFEKLRSNLIEFADENTISHDDLLCTLVMVVKTDWGFLSANIGDGRSGYSDSNPAALSVPFMTYTVGATFFLIKENWDIMFRSYITILDQPDKLKFFFVSSDGCQEFLIDKSSKGPREGIYDKVLGDNAFYDKNVPYEPFFDGLIASLNEVKTEEERNNRLEKLVEFGQYHLAGEEKELNSLSDPRLDDDKTFLIFHV